MSEFPNLFGLPGEELKTTHVSSHRIITTIDEPMRTKTFPDRPEIEEEMQREIDKNLKEGIIRQSNSPYQSMCWVVPKRVAEVMTKYCVW